MDSTQTAGERRAEAAHILASMEWLAGFVSCEGPLSHLPTSDPAVRVLCSALRHLKARYRRVA